MFFAYERKLLQKLHEVFFSLPRETRVWKNHDFSIRPLLLLLSFHRNAKFDAVSSYQKVKLIYPQFFVFNAEPLTWNFLVSVFFVWIISEDIKDDVSSLEVSSSIYKVNPVESISNLKILYSEPHSFLCPTRASHPQFILFFFYFSIFG